MRIAVRAFRRVTRLEYCQHGSTMIELMVAAFISTVFIFAAGSAYLVNQTAYRRNTEKLHLQQTATLVLEEMEKKIRLGASAVIAVSDRIVVNDLNGNEITRFRVATVGLNSRLFEQTAVLAEQDLITLKFMKNPSGTAVQITLTLEDSNKNRVTMKASAALRNHPELRNVSP